MSEATCIGIGLIALDVLLNGNEDTPPQYFAGGSCGNVMAILSYLGWHTYPIARLRNNIAGEILVKDFERFGVNSTFLTLMEDGSTPIIIHRILKIKDGKTKHRFEFRNPENGKYLPSYKPVLSSNIEVLTAKIPSSKVLYIDRINRASIEIAKVCKNRGTFVFYEPSSINLDKQTQELFLLADIIKFSYDRISNYTDLYPICKCHLEIMTVGDKGLYYRTKEKSEWTYMPAYSINCVIDAAGSGDWCTSGIIYKIFDKNGGNYFTTENIENALKFGQALGAINCALPGARGIMYIQDANTLFNQLDDYMIKSDYSDFCNLNMPLQNEQINKGLPLFSLYT